MLDLLLNLWKVKLIAQVHNKHELGNKLRYTPTTTGHNYWFT